eukprot:730205-Amphidinium_carterae.1
MDKASASGAGDSGFKSQAAQESNGNGGGKESVQIGNTSTMKTRCRKDDSQSGRQGVDAALRLVFLNGSTTFEARRVELNIDV